jgi:hypothetical protein
MTDVPLGEKDSDKKDINFSKSKKEEMKMTDWKSGRWKIDDEDNDSFENDKTIDKFEKNSKDVFDVKMVNISIIASILVINVLFFS